MTRQNQNEPIRLIIDYGPIEHMLRSFHAVGEGFAGKTEVKVTGLQITEEAKARFGRQTDLLAARHDSPIAHVYEYTAVHGEADATPAGRLWYITGKEMGTMTVTFRASTRPVPIDPREPNPEGRARHEFPYKAWVQEYQRVTYQFAGRAQYRTTPGESKWLLIYDNQGRPMFRKTWATYSPYYGNFRDWFHGWWNKEAMVDAEHQAERQLQSEFAPVMEREVSNYIRKNTRRPMPNKVTGASPVTFTNNNKPLVRGFNTKPAPSIKKKTTSNLRKIFGRKRV